MPTPHLPTSRRNVYTPRQHAVLPLSQTLLPQALLPQAPLPQAPLPQMGEPQRSHHDD
jgi:hypothetical protein